MILNVVDRNAGSCKVKTNDAKIRCVILLLAATNSILVSEVTYDERHRIDEPVDLADVVPASYDL